MSELTIKDRTADDCCLFCAGHIGHYFEAEWDRDWKQYLTREGWIVIEHLSQCYVFICPSCIEQIKKFLLKDSRVGETP